MKSLFVDKVEWITNVVSKAIYKETTQVKAYLDFVLIL
jgi:hypothetical protein